MEVRHQPRFVKVKATLRRLDDRVLGVRVDALASSAWSLPLPGTWSEPKLFVDLKAWGLPLSLRFVGSLLLLVAGLAAAVVIGIAPPWLLLPAFTVLAAPLNRRWRNALRSICYVSAALNVLAFFYVIALLPTMALFFAAGKLAPAGVYSKDGTRADGSAPAAKGWQRNDS